MTFGLFGCRKAERSNSSDVDVDRAGLLASKEVSMVDSWAVRDMSIWVCGENLLETGYQRIDKCVIIERDTRFLTTRPTLYSFT